METRKNRSHNRVDIDSSQGDSEAGSQIQKPACNLSIKGSNTKNIQKNHPTIMHIPSPLNVDVDTTSIKPTTGVKPLQRQLLDKLSRGYSTQHLIKAH